MAATLLLLLVKASVFANVAALGASSPPRHLLSVLSARGQLARAFLSMQVVLPSLTVLMVVALDLHPALRIALVAMSLSPVPPLLPNKAMKVTGVEGYAVGLLAAMALASIAWIPLSLEILEQVFSVSLYLSPGTVLSVALESIALPLGVGMALRQLAPRWAERLVRPASAIGGVALLIGALVIVVVARPALARLIGDGTLLAVVAWSALGVFVGHWLGGPDAARRPVLALATSSRHPAVALALAHANFPDQRLAPAAVVLVLLANALVTAFYVAWIKRRSAALEQAPSTR